MLEFIKWAIRFRVEGRETIRKEEKEEGWKEGRKDGKETRLWSMIMCTRTKRFSPPEFLRVRYLIFQCSWATGSYLVFDHQDHEEYMRNICIRNMCLRKICGV